MPRGRKPRENETPAERKAREARAKKRREQFRRRAARHQPGMARNIPAFCLNNDISVSFYYSLKRKGRGPREMELEGRTLITPEAEADWRRAMEAETAVKRERKRAIAAAAAAQDTAEREAITTAA
jgi:hypothetical protein